MAKGLLCRDLRLSRPGIGGEPRWILDGVSAHFAPGSLALITGTIGAGKTTLLHVLSMILRPEAGEVLVDGEPVSRFAAAHRDRWRRQAGLAFQAAHFFDELTVLENVMVPLLPRVDSMGEARGRALAELSRFGIEALATRGLSGLSGGERQRITLARALVGDPRYLFADEPTAHQDGEGVALILERLAEGRSSGATVVVVSHDLRLRQSDLVDTTWVLENGRLEAAR